MSTLNYNESSLIAFAPYVTAYILDEAGVNQSKQLIVELFVYLPDGYTASAPDLGSPVGGVFTQEIHVKSEQVSESYFTLRRTFVIQEGSSSESLEVKVNHNGTTRHAYLSLSDYLLVEDESRSIGYSPNGLAYGYTYGYLTRGAATLEGEGEPVENIFANYLLVSASPFSINVDKLRVPKPFAKLRLTIQKPGKLDGSKIVGKIAVDSDEGYEALEIFTDDAIASHDPAYQIKTRGPVILSYTNID
ncbi:MAG: hypothetical protein AAFR59_07445, partial [Bacteroidota bacterium]